LIESLYIFLKGENIMKNAFRETSINILRMFVEDPYLQEDRTSYDVQALIDDVRGSLSPADEQVGIWEAIELNAADRALATGFPQLALIFTAKALAIFQLSREEYKYGLDLLRGETAAIAQNEQAQMQASAAREATAAHLLAVDTAAAEALTGAQIKAAKDLARAQQRFAIDLRREQNEDAINLVEENIQDAARLASDGAEEIQKFAANEIQRNVYQGELEQIVSWASGSYSVAPSLFSGESFCEVMHRDRSIAAMQLKTHQQKAAKKLRLSHEKLAKNLAQFVKVEADYLKASQRQTAIELAEKKTVQAIRKKIKEEQISRSAAVIQPTED
jgi:hypothetical protein